MSTQYFVWKNPDCNGINPEWIEMTAYEFFLFRREPENKERYFVILGADDCEEAGTLIMEATKDAYREWHKQDKAVTRRARANAASNRVIVSLYDYIPESEDLAYEDIIPSGDESVEAQVMKKLDLQRLRDFLNTLSEEEMEIINALYLCNPDELSEREIARRLGVPQKTLNCAKQRIFKKF